MLALLLLALLALRLVAILFSAADFHYEEAANWYRSLGADRNAAPPLLPWLIGLSTAICGDGEACIRMPAPLFAAAAAFTVYILALRLYDRATAFWSALVYATLPGISAFAMVAMSDAVLAFFAATTLLALVRHLEGRTLATGLALGASAGLGLLTDGGMGWLLACTLIYLAATPRARTILAVPGTWLAIAMMALAASPYLRDFFADGAPDIAGKAAAIGQALGHIDPDQILAVLALQFLLLGPILLAVLARSAMVRPTILPRMPADRLLLFHSVPIFVAILVLAFFDSAKGHWTMPAFPAAAIYVIALLSRHGFRRLLLAAFAINLAATAAILLAGPFARTIRDLPAFDRLVGWEEFAAGLERAAASSDIDIVVLRGGEQTYQALYYLRDADLEIRAFNPRGRRPGNPVERDRGWAYGDADTVLLATGSDPSSFGIPLGVAEKIGEFTVHPRLSETGSFSLYRVNPPADGTPRRP